MPIPTLATTQWLKDFLRVTQTLEALLEKEFQCLVLETPSHKLVALQTKKESSIQNYEESFLALQNTPAIKDETLKNPYLQKTIQKHLEKIIFLCKRNEKEIHKLHLTIKNNLQSAQEKNRHPYSLLPTTLQSQNLMRRI